MKIGRLELKWLQKPRSYKQKVADNMNYIGSLVGANSADIRKIKSDYITKEDLKDRLIPYSENNNYAFEQIEQIKETFAKLDNNDVINYHSEEIEKIKETLKTITVVLDGLTKRK